ncbi:MAG: hypothetical protein M1587_07200 [Thaumarchaeota archaeon]|nr:hypothetical protein [Nitrososphaerota archaeon]
MKQKLGSEERAKSSIILMGLMEKLSRKRTEASKKQIEEIKSNFEEVVGISYRNFENLIDML